MSEEIRFYCANPKCGSEISGDNMMYSRREGELYCNTDCAINAAFERGDKLSEAYEVSREHAMELFELMVLSERSLSPLEREAEEL